MPAYTVGKVVDALNDRETPLAMANILVIGATFKKDIDDARNSPAIEVMRQLAAKGANVSYHDPYVPTVTVEDGEGQLELKSVPLTDHALELADCVVVAVAHSSLNLAQIVKQARVVVDATGATRKLKETDGNVVRL